MLRIGSVVMNVPDLANAGVFWSKALDYRRSTGNPDFLVPKDGVGPRVHLDRQDGTHLDLWVDNEAEQLAEADRPISLAATRGD